MTELEPRTHLGLATAISEGEPVDWISATAEAGVEKATLLAELEVIEAIAQVHRDLFEDGGSLLDAAESVAEGSPIDWEDVEETSSEEDRELIPALREISRVAESSRSVQQGRLQGLESAAAPEDLETVTRSWGRFELREQVGSGSFGDL